ncbi:MAG: VWA domain-containing protein [Bacteroidetes bacterium]|nr:VWA domain-containing protein [Bacteroidota bacterium]
MKGKRVCGYLSMVIFILLCRNVRGEGGGPSNRHNDTHRPLDIVFCVDLSGSTNGLINDLRDNLWMIINLAENMEPKPSLRIGVVGFSRPSFGKENAYVKILAPLTKNFDFVVSELYKLRPSIEKGDQIVSAAIHTCLNDMKWSDRNDAVKMVYLVGNGMVTANGHEYVRYCEQARQKNIPFHAIYVMKSANWFNELPGYRRIAGLTNGMQTEITINKPDNVPVWTSVTSDLTQLNLSYNSTFLWSGPDSGNCRRAMVASDSGAYYATNDAFLNRLYCKSREHYRNNFSYCDIVSNTALVYADVGPEVSNEYQNRIKELLTIREQLRIQLNTHFPSEDLNKIQQAYIKGEMPDNNILHRCVMNILYRSWGMR